MGFNLTIMTHCYLIIYVIIANFQNHCNTLLGNCYGYDLSGLEDKLGLIITGSLFNLQLTTFNTTSLFSQNIVFICS